MTSLVQPQDLILAPRLGPQRAAALLRRYGFRDAARADANLQAIADEPRSRERLAAIIRELLDGLARSADPDQALDYLERFTRATLNKVHLLSYLHDSPYTLGLLATLFGSSPFLSEILIRNPTYVYWVADQQLLRQPRGKRILQAELTAALRPLRSPERKFDLLRRFKRRELLRIGARDLLQLCAVDATATALSDLADAVIQKALEVSAEAVIAEIGGPKAGRRHAAGRGFAVIAMGKLGGSELNFSSDVDLIYIHGTGAPAAAGRGQTRAPIDPAEFYSRLARALTTGLCTITHEGYLYRVDLRLRPLGSTGPMVFALRDVRRHYATLGQTWERLALLKARPIAGDRAVGQGFVRQVTGFMFQPPLTPALVEDVRRIKQKIDRKIAAKGQARRNVKLGLGGIREIEFIVQTLQVGFGARRRRLRDRNTLAALDQLERLRLLAAPTCAALRHAYRFLRDVEHKLQMVGEAQTHSLPPQAAELRRCALRLGYRDAADGDASTRFLRYYQMHTTAVNRIFRERFDPPASAEGIAPAITRRR